MGQIQPGEPAPDFELPDQNDTRVRLSQFRGENPVVLFFYPKDDTTGCTVEACTFRDEMARFDAFRAKIIGISSDSDEEEWREFTVKNKMIWPQYLDHDRRIQRAFGIHAFPTYILIDHEGIVRFSSIGAGWLRAANLSDAVNKQIKIVARSTEAR